MLGEQALRTIAEAHLDEDINELVLADAEFQENRYLRLDYDAGIHLLADYTYTRSSTRNFTCWIR